MKKSYKTLELPDFEECKTSMKEVFKDPQALPHAVRKLSMADAEPHHASAVRTAEHEGRSIEIRTTYEILIDEKPFQGRVMVDDEGHLHCHSIPYESYGSAIDFVKRLIDTYPDSFPARAGCEGTRS